MKYEIGQKVETPLGVGLVKVIDKDLKGNTLIAVNIGKLPIDYIGISFKESDIKPYRTPHEKVLEMGYECEAREGIKIYRHPTLSNFRVYYDNTISCNDIDLELSRIIAEYLEWLEEGK